MNEAAVTEKALPEDPVAREVEELRRKRDARKKDPHLCAICGRQQGLTDKPCGCRVLVGGRMYPKPRGRRNPHRSFGQPDLRRPR